MGTSEIREKFIKFFKASPRDHREIPAAPLVLEEDATTLFTSAGMQPLVPYLKGKKHPQGKRLVNSQPSFRTQDIEEVGDNRHTTYFEMLGNWSLGNYWKREQLSWFWEFCTRELKLPPGRLYVTVFKGDRYAPLDEESVEVWKSLGVKDNCIYKYGASYNWWSRSGAPDDMVQGDIGGPDSEVFFDFGEGLQLHERSAFRGKRCHPNCDCGRFLEIGNSVFIEYEKKGDGLIGLSQRNVDFGGGLERLAAAVSDDSDIFKIDVFAPIVQRIEKKFGVSYGESFDKDRSVRVMADHLRASVELMLAGVEPSNKRQGYVLRQLIRRSMFHGYLLDKTALEDGFNVRFVIDAMKGRHPGLQEGWQEIDAGFQVEANRFVGSLARGMKKLRRAIDSRKRIDGAFAFDLYQTDGFPLLLTMEILEREGKSFSDEDKKSFVAEYDKHRALSRSASVGMFRGGLVEQTPETARLHTATHLLHQALREVLGKNVRQVGSNITSERLRFDFSHEGRLTQEELRRVEDLVNEKIKEGLDVTFREMSLDDAVKSGALAFFGEKYGKRVKVYTISPSTGSPRRGSGQAGPPFSREVCGGPHVDNTREIGRVRITKEESAGAGVRRVYAVVE